MAYTVIFAKSATRDLTDLFDLLLPNAGPEISQAFVSRIYDLCLSLEHFPDRGAPRDEIRKGLRIMNYQRRVSIAFTTIENKVVILRVLYAGQQFDADESFSDL